MRLYDLSEQYNDLLDMLEQDSDNEALQAMLDGLEDAFDSKVESIVKLIRSKSAERDAIDQEKQRLHSRAQKLDKDVEWLHNYIQREMERTGRDKVRSSLFSISIAKCPPSVNVLDETIIPEMFVGSKVVFSIDKRAILEHLKAGVEIPGVQLAQRQTLKIK